MKQLLPILPLALTIITMGCASTGDASGADTPQAEKKAVSTESAQVSAEENYDPDELVCKKTQKVGTRLKTKVCATRQEWELYEAQAQDVTEELQRRGPLGPATTQ